MYGSGDQFREIGRLTGGPPGGSWFRLVLALIGSLLIAGLGVLMIRNTITGPHPAAPGARGVPIGGWFGDVLGVGMGVLLLLTAAVVALGGVHRFRLARNYRRLPADGSGLTMVEGPVSWVRYRNRLSDSLVVGDQQFSLTLLRGPLAWRNLTRALPVPAVGRAWFVSSTGMADPILVRLDARARTDAELLADLQDLERRFAETAAADSARPDRYRRLIAALPTLRAGFQPGAPVSARVTAAAELDRWKRELDDAAAAALEQHERVALVQNELRSKLPRAAWRDGGPPPPSA